MKNLPRRAHAAQPSAKSFRLAISLTLVIVSIGVTFLIVHSVQSSDTSRESLPLPSSGNVWVDRARVIGLQFRRVYTPTWEGANGAIGNAYLFAATHDSSLLRFHTVERPMTDMFNGTWVDDRAWICLAELSWWRVTGQNNRLLVEDAKNRYVLARTEGRLSKHEGFWSWYNWPPTSDANKRSFTNSNMNQMANVACRLFEATGDSSFLRDALLVWNGDRKTPGVERTFYRGGGVWQGNAGPAAFGKQLPWEGTEYCSVAAALYSVTHDEKFKRIAVATIRHITDPKTGWLDTVAYYQLRMDGNGAFVNFLLDAYEIAPEELKEIPLIVERMLDHVWTNAHGRARVVLHRESDHAIRNGWNPNGGEDGYGVDEIGTIHAQSQALRAFGIFAFVSGSKSSHIAPSN